MLYGGTDALVSVLTSVFSHHNISISDKFLQVICLLTFEFLYTQMKSQKET